MVHIKRVIFQYMDKRLNFVPVLAKNIELDKSYIYDIALQCKSKLNSTSVEILTLMDGKNSIIDIINEMHKRYKSTDEIIDNDVRSLIFEANKNNILNLNLQSKNTLDKVLIIPYVKLRYKIYHRFDVSALSFLKIYWEMLKIIGNKFILICLLVNFILIIMAFFNVLYDESISIIKLMFFFNTCLFGFCTSISMHESVHIYFFRKALNNPNAGFIVSRGFLLYFKRRLDYVNKNDIFVKLVGSLVPFSIGCLGVIISSCLFEGFFNILFLAFFFTYIIHLLNLLPIFGDGRSIVVTLLKKQFKW